MKTKKERGRDGWREEGGDETKGKMPSVAPISHSVS